jgi:hypothetical protein
MKPLLTDQTKYVSLADNTAQAMYDQLRESSYLHYTDECVVKCDVPYWAAQVVRDCDSIKMYVSVIDGKFALVSFEPLLVVRYHFDRYEVNHGEKYAFRTPHVEAVIEFVNKYAK